MDFAPLTSLPSGRQIPELFGDNKSNWKQENERVWSVCEVGRAGKICRYFTGCETEVLMSPTDFQGETQSCRTNFGLHSGSTHPDADSTQSTWSRAML